MTKILIVEDEPIVARRWSWPMPVIRGIAQLQSWCAEPLPWMLQREDGTCGLFCSAQPMI
jgi:hypothetical protein